MRRIMFLLMGAWLLLPAAAQKKNFSYKFYGQVRADLFYNSRANAETVDGLFHLYPKDHAYDAVGKDLNATPNGSFYLLYSRLGIDVAGPNVGKATTTAKLEADFRGSGGNFALLRIRQAYINLDWGHSAVLVGQTWHPLFGDVAPQMLNLSTGGPFQPFNRSPLIRYRYEAKYWRLTAAAIWQLQYLSAGPNGKSEEYIKNGCLPELYAGIDFRTANWTAGAGLELLSLRMRTRSVVGAQTFRVNERLSSLSPEAHFLYKDSRWHVAAKTLLASNLTQCSMLGGYGVTALDARTGEMDYTPFRHSATWLNVVYGTRWKPGVFVGYLKNLGAGKPIKSYGGIGMEVGSLLSLQLQLTYNLPHWKLGAEYGPSVAWYGTVDPTDGSVVDTHSVANHRVVCVAMFMF